MGVTVPFQEKCTLRHIEPFEDVIAFTSFVLETVSNLLTVQAQPTQSVLHRIDPP